jgi:hypothetical protein
MSLCFYDQNLGILKKVRILMKATKLELFKYRFSIRNVIK